MFLQIAFSKWREQNHGFLDTLINNIINDIRSTKIPSNSNQRTVIDNIERWKKLVFQEKNKYKMQTDANPYGTK